MVSAAFLTQTVNLDENTSIKFEIWDTVSPSSTINIYADNQAGQERISTPFR